MTQSSRSASLLLAAALFCLACPVLAGPDHTFTWIEGEAPTARNYDVSTHGWGNPECLSGGAWLAVGEGDAKKMPQEGISLEYAFEVPAAGSYELWGRLGFFTIWYPFEWRLDGGEWRSVPRDNVPTVGFMPIMRFHKMVWTRFDVRQLKAGKHTLGIRLAHPKNVEPEGRKNKKPRLLFAADAFCVYKGRFNPNGHHQPGADWQTDADRKAAGHVFRLGEAGGEGGRVELPLEGLWQFARYDDPDRIENRLGPIGPPPDADDLHWSAIEVPGSRNDVRPNMIDAHRFFYRTRVHVPAGHEGRSFYLEFPMNNMITTVFVNGRRVGYSMAPYACFRCDITDAVKPGADNEVWVGIKDIYYGISPKLLGNDDIRTAWARPMRENAGYLTNILDMPIALMGHEGMLDRPLLVSAGRVYAEDVYVTTSVAEKRIAVEATLRNPTGRPVEVEVTHEIAPWKGGEAVKSLPARKVTVGAGESRAVEAAQGWAEPRLWWPDDPHLYALTTTLRSGGRVLDVKRTRFGFREWDWSTTRFKLNGVVWKLWQSGHHHGKTPAERWKKVREANQDMVRWRIGLGDSRRKFAGLNLREFLDFADENGIIVRVTAPFDGMFASYNGNPEKAPKLYEHAAHMISRVFKGLRGHPSIGFWSLQNEIVLINIRNVAKGGPVMDACRDAVRKYDATRPILNDGAGATGTLETTGIHYPAVSQARHYPDEAYTWEVSRGLRGGNPHGRRAVLDMTKPVFVGEGYYTGGKSIGWFASVDGSECFRGIAHCENARQKMGQIYVEGWRWQGVAAADLLTGPGYHMESMAPVALFCRQWDWTHASGAKVDRTLKVFNMTRRGDPVTAKWTLAFGGKAVDKGERTFDLAPGTAREFAVALTMPETDARAEGTLALVCEQGGEEVFRAVKDVSVIDPDRAPTAPAPAGGIVVLDKAGAVSDRLKRRGVKHTRVESADAIPVGARLIVVGPDSLSKQDARSAMWKQLAAAGKRIIVLDQEHPLLGEAVDADLKVSGFTGRIAFMENMLHPIFEGLEQKDFFTRGADHLVYREVYEKPSKGARSLMQCDADLAYSALLEAQVGDGLLLLCQAMAGTKLDSDPVFQRLFDNMVTYALAYERVINPVAVVAPDGERKRRFLEEINLAFTAFDDPVEAIESGKARIVIVDATAANLNRLAGAAEKVRAFTEGGGWVMVWGVTPEVLESFNSLVGVDHIIRPFRQERVSLRRPVDPLAIGISERDVAMTTGKRYMRFMNTEIPSKNAFTYAVDYTDIAPFCEYPSPKYFKHFDEDPLNSGHHPLNMVNNMTSRDNWRFLFYLHLFDGSPTKWTVKLPRRERIDAFEIIPNSGYHDITKFKLTFDGEPDKPLVFDTEVHEKPVVQRFDFEPVEAESVEMEIVEWNRDGKQNVLGIDNLWLHATRSDAFHKKVHPLLTAGVLNRYTMGAGGVVLNQVKLLDAEPNPENAAKKKGIVKNLLSNLHAAFGEEPAKAAGTDIVGYTPVVFGGGQVNLFLSRDDNWPDPEHDLSKLPTGPTRLRDVPYTIFDNPLAPAEANVAGLGSMGKFKGADRIEVPVDRKAAGLFFLHTFLREKGGEFRSDDPPVVLRYTVRYADGSKASFPVRLTREIGSWLAGRPKDLPAARVAWQADSRGGRKTVLYHAMWENPHPDKAIGSVELAITDAGEKLGMAVVAAITAAAK